MLQVSSPCFVSLPSDSQSERTNNFQREISTGKLNAQQENFKLFVRRNNGSSSGGQIPVEKMERKQERKTNGANVMRDERNTRFNEWASRETFCPVALSVSTSTQRARQGKAAKAAKAAKAKTENLSGHFVPHFSRIISLCDTFAQPRCGR